MEALPAALATPASVPFPIANPALPFPPGIVDQALPPQLDASVETAREGVVLVRLEHKLIFQILPLTRWLYLLPENGEGMYGLNRIMTDHTVLKHMTAPISNPPVGLALSDGSRWGISGGDEIASNIVFHLAEVLQLKPYNSFENRLIILSNNPENEPITEDQRSHNLNSCRPAVGLNDNSDPLVEAAALFSKTVSFFQNSKTFVCNVTPAENGDLLALQLMQVAGIICRYSQDKGGVLLHGALAERDGYGVILAGPGDAGKTTASLRLPKPWQALCDDSTLVVRDRHGAYWAHPWPTWSRFMFGGTGGSWNVQRALPLKSIFFLTKAAQDQVVPIGGGEAACMLVNSTEQVWRPMVLGLPRDSFRKGCLQRFNNICSLVKAVPCYRLCLSRKGSFWEEIERIIDGSGAVSHV